MNSAAFNVRGEIVTRHVAMLNEEVERKLRELGPGWAVGWRVKEPVACFDQKPLYEQPKSEITYEFHSAEVVDGAVPIGVAGFHYVTLVEQ